MLTAWPEAAVPASGLHHDRYRSVGTDHRLREAVAEPRQIWTDLDSISQPRPAQLLLHGRHRHDTLVRVLQVLPGFLRLHGPRLQEKDAGDDLEAVGDAVPHLFEQHLLLAQQLVLLAFGSASLGDVLDGQQQSGVGVGFVEYLTRVEQQRPAADRTEFVLDLIGLDRALSGNDLFEKRPKRGYVPLTPGQLVEQPPSRFLQVPSRTPGRMSGSP